MSDDSTTNRGFSTTPEKSQPGFIRVPKTLLKHPGVSQSGKLLYGLILCLADGVGYCWAGDQYMADECGLSLRQVKRTIAEMEQARIILIVGSTRKRHIRPNWEACSLFSETLISDKNGPNQYNQDSGLVTETALITGGLVTEMAPIRAISVIHNIKEIKNKIKKDSTSSFSENTEKITIAPPPPTEATDGRERDAASPPRRSEKESPAAEPEVNTSLAGRRLMMTGDSQAARDWRRKRGIPEPQKGAENGY